MTDNTKISIRFFNDREVRAIWDEENSKWWFSVLDIVAVLNEQDDYNKIRNYWKYLKGKLKKENNELVSATNQLKLTASDGNKYLTDTLDSDGVISLTKNFPNNKATKFIDWFTYSDTTIDGQSKKSDLLSNINKIHTTELGIIRIKRNLSLETDDIVNWCKQQIQHADSIKRKGKNWYVEVINAIITVNANSYTIITAHKKQKIK